MASIGLFRSALLNEQGQPVIKAIVVGDDLADEVLTIIEGFLASTEDQLLVLPEGTRVGWLG